MVEAMTRYDLQSASKLTLSLVDKIVNILASQDLISPGTRSVACGTNDNLEEEAETMAYHDSKSQMVNVSEIVGRNSAALPSSDESSRIKVISRTSQSCSIEDSSYGQTSQFLALSLCLLPRPDLIREPTTDEEQDLYARGFGGRTLHLPRNLPASNLTAAVLQEYPCLNSSGFSYKIDFSGELQTFHPKVNIGSITSILDGRILYLNPLSALPNEKLYSDLTKHTQPISSPSQLPYCGPSSSSHYSLEALRPGQLTDVLIKSEPIEQHGFDINSKFPVTSSRAYSAEGRDNRPRQQRSLVADPFFDVLPSDHRHRLEKVPATQNKLHPQKKCRVCRRLGRRRDVRQQCSGCPGQPGLCRGICFQLWHSASLPVRRSRCCLPPTSSSFVIGGGGSHASANQIPGRFTVSESPVYFDCTATTATNHDATSNRVDNTMTVNDDEKVLIVSSESGQ